MYVLERPAEREPSALVLDLDVRGDTIDTYLFCYTLRLYNRDSSKRTSEAVSGALSTTP